MKKLRLLLAGSGTAGPVMPLVALAQELSKREVINEVLFLGTSAGPERSIVEHADIPFRVFPAGKLRRYFSWKTIPDAFRIVWGFVRALFLIRSWKPDVFVSAGGFIAPPIAWACYVLRVPVVLHQQDAGLLLSDRLIRPVATRITVSLKSSLSLFPPQKTLWTGNPVREGVSEGSADAAIKRFSLDASKPTILCMGGGTGSVALNEQVVRALPEWLPRANVVHLTGRGKQEAVLAQQERLRLEGIDLSRYHAFSFLQDELSDLLVLADVVVSRAGFSTLTELALLKKPTVLIPLPSSMQERNARAFQEGEAVVVLEQDDDHLTEVVVDLLQDAPRRAALSEAIGRFYKPGAVSHVADVVQDVVNA